MTKSKEKSKIKLALADKFISYKKVCQFTNDNIVTEERETYRGCGKVKIVASMKSNEELYVI